MTHRLKAAFTKVIITPEEPVQLAGYGFRTDLAEPKQDVLDELYARIVVLNEGDQQIVFVSLDCCMISEENMQVPYPGKPGEYRFFANSLPVGTREQWAIAAGTSLESIFVHATHTHSGTAQFTGKYTDRISQAIRDATHLLIPVNVFAANGESDISAYRRPELKPNLDVEIDKSLYVLFFETLQGQPLGSLVNYAVHPTCLNDISKISSEFVGLAMSKFEQHLGNGFVSLFVQGFSGDVCPAFGGIANKENTYPAMLETADIIYADILSLYHHRKRIDPLPLVVAGLQFNVPTREQFYAAEVPVQIMGLRLGEAVILSVSGEVFNKYTEIIKEMSTFPYTLTAGLTNGYCGYIPTSSAFVDGLDGYEINTTPFDERIQGLILNQTQIIFNQLKAGTNK